LGERWVGGGGGGGWWGGAAARAVRGGEDPWRPAVGCTSQMAGLEDSTRPTATCRAKKGQKLIALSGGSYHNGELVGRAFLLRTASRPEVDPDEALDPGRGSIAVRIAQRSLRRLRHHRR